jgi:hypothetical protein
MCCRPCTHCTHAVFVNGGLVLSLFLGTMLWEHRSALQAERLLQKKVKAKKGE